ncbi:MAG: hypothetical protein IMF02_04930 [Proteobacteria bacterium]|nr:hypothetical protein [Pseudomonadota bacterium]
MTKWITDRPYLVTSAIFLIIMIIGWQVLYWQAEDFTFLLLLYFIVTLGIRLDDISRKIGGGAGKLSAGSVDQESVISQLNDIKVSLGNINVTLNKLLAEKKESDR